MNNIKSYSAMGKKSYATAAGAERAFAKLVDTTWTLTGTQELPSGRFCFVYSYNV